MADWKIYHNPRCSKSREALKLLKEHGLSPEVVLYLEDPPTAKEIQSLLKKLPGSPAELVRKKETIFKEVDAFDLTSAKEVASTIAKHPKLFERPVVVCGTQAVIGRPTERGSQFISDHTA